MTWSQVRILSGAPTESFENPGPQQWPPGAPGADPQEVSFPMTHYFERNHGERFTTLMDKHLPDWRSRRDQFNEAPFAEEDWAVRT